MYTKLADEDRVMINYIKSMQGEYGDSLIKDDFRDNFYWNIASIRRDSFSFYPIEKEADILLVGDKFGTLTGIVSEKVHTVDTIVPTEEHADGIRVRYSKRDNVNVIIEPYDDWKLPQKYSYVFINLEYAFDYDIINTYMFDCLVNPAVGHLNTNGKLLISASGERLPVIQRLIYKLGFKYWQYCDPLGNGALFIEASRSNTLSKFELPEATLLVNDKWVRKYGIPFRGGEIYDQDLKRIDAVKEVEVDLLRKLVSVCEEQKLEVYPIYGTLLGIIRDGGMISGDDDVDVVMPRRDYEKLIELADKFDGKYFLQTPFNDDCFYGGYLKLRNRNTTAIHPQNEWTNACEGISIDIFPIDSSYMDEEKELKKKKKIRLLQRLLYAKSYGYFRDFKDMKLLKWKAYKYIGKLFDRNKMIKELYQEMKKGDESNSIYAIYTHYANGSVNNAKYIDISAFKDKITLLYEGVSMSVPAGWDRILRDFYGESYLCRLGFNEGKKRHGFYDVNVPYEVYKERFGGLKYPASIQEEVVLFGDGSVFKGCLEYYKEKVNITHLVQLPGEEPMNAIMGIPVESWENFQALALPKDAYRPIICSGDARFAEKVLRNAGYERYYIFWYNREWMLYANQSQIWKEIQEMK